MPTNSSNGAPKDPITSGAKAALDAFNMTIGAGAEHGYDVFQSAMQTWLKETQRFQEEMFSQGAAALERLRTCKSPVDVLTVEQAWVAARSRAYLEAGPRFAKILAVVAQDLQPGQAADADKRGS